MALKILGVSGSPVKKGNVETFLTHAMEGLPAKNIQLEIVHLSGLKIGDCIHCNFCLKKQTPGKYCSLKDDAQPIFEKAEAADILVLAGPVYFMRSSVRMAALLDRFRVFVFGNLAGGKMKNKIGNLKRQFKLEKDFAKKLALDEEIKRLQKEMNDNEFNTFDIERELEKKCNRLIGGKKRSLKLDYTIEQVFDVTWEVKS